MSKREWKPGDVAWRSHLGREYRSLRVPGCDTDGHDEGPHWHHADGGWDQSGGRSTYRPLVVIDPEDREQVEALFHMAHRTPADLAAALREFANPTPPKPDEPQGLGAVVEDANGFKWVRTHTTGYPWHSNLDASDRNLTAARKYEQVAAVRVLSEGVTA